MRVIRTLLAASALTLAATTQAHAQTMICVTTTTTTTEYYPSGITITEIHILRTCRPMT